MHSFVVLVLFCFSAKIIRLFYFQAMKIHSFGFHERSLIQIIESEIMFILIARTHWCECGNTLVKIASSLNHLQISVLRPKLCGKFPMKLLTKP